MEGKIAASHRGYPCRVETTYWVRITRQGARRTFAVDDQVMIDFGGEEANPLHQRGLMGFRPWRTHVQWVNLIGRRLPPAQIASP